MGIHQTRKPRAVEEQANGNGQPEPKRFYTQREAAKFLNLTLWAVRQLVRRDEIKCVENVNTRAWLISRTELERFAQVMADSISCPVQESFTPSSEGEKVEAAARVQEIGEFIQRLRTQGCDDDTIKRQIVLRRLEEEKASARKPRLA